MPPVRHLTQYLGLNEPISALTHLFAAFVAVLALGVLLRRARGSPRRTVAVTIFAVAGIYLFGSSGVYHAVPLSDPARPLLWRLDHAGVWLILAATFSSIRVLAVDGRFGGRGQVALWTVAALGVATELWAIDALPYWVSPMLYIGMGWLGLPTLLAVARLHPTSTLASRMWAGGLLATIGGIMDAAEWPSPLPRIVEYHELLHACTATGGALFCTVVHDMATGAFEPGAEPASEPEADGALEPIRVPSGRF
jgi:hemolysin III